MNIKINHKLKIFADFAEANKSVSMFTVQYGGRNTGRVHFLSMLYKDKMEHLLYAGLRGEFVKYVENVLSDFRDRYKKLPNSYPGDYVFYSLACRCIETKGADFLGDHLKDELENYFKLLESNSCLGHNTNLLFY